MTQAPSPPSILVGIHEDTNANAAAVDGGGRILGAVAEGRISRVKYAGGFPEQGIQWLADSGALGGRGAEPVLSSSSWPPAELQDADLALIVANPYHPLPRFLGGKLPEGSRDFREPLQTAHLAWHQLLFRSRLLRGSVEQFCRNRLEKRFRRDFDFVGHHACHAASAYFTGPWSEATLVTCDNMGDGECASVFHGRDGSIEALWSVGAWHSPGQFYGEVASFLGIDPMTAGKVTGLAARGQAGAALDILRRRLRPSSDGKRFIGPPVAQRRRHSRDWSDLSGLPAADVAAGAQACLEETLVAFVREAVRSTGCPRVALAGGVFANVTLNRKIAELAEVESIWVHPAKSDQGIGTGAALLALSRRRPLQPRPMEHVFLGPSFTDSQCARALENAGLVPQQPDDLAEAAAQLLDEGKVLARFDGALEYGPRALGNLSVLVRPDDPEVNDWLNTQLNRSEYMPFAPVTLAEQSDSIYEGTEPVEHCLPFMTVAVPVKEPGDPAHSGVIHVDGTARPQVLRRDANPGMHDILSAFHRRSGIPSLINTSFNRHGEPIVCSPEDAVTTFLEAGLDGLLLGPFLVTKPGG
ncbi:MAG: carbamoyltransferase C-terminal domain-containing protein [Myxococcota bacterium]|nr:carbamoyltransferase C-terminal domain-containing protein [Myxococcota bacterium]